MPREFLRWWWGMAAAGFFVFFVGVCQSRGAVVDLHSSDGARAMKTTGKGVVNAQVMWWTGFWVCRR